MGRYQYMPRRTPGHHRRTLAMYQLDRVLGTDVIPPTFMARHQETARRIIELSDSRQDLVRNALTGYISNVEIEATLSRLKVLAKFMKPIIEKSDGLVFSSK
jgi:hypothetical protein